jgi:hypothetical protein
MSRLTLGWDVDFPRAQALATTRERCPRSMHATVTYSAIFLGLWRINWLFGFVRNGAGLFARASAVVAYEWDKPF